MSCALKSPLSGGDECETYNAEHGVHYRHRGMVSLRMNGLFCFCGFVDRGDEEGKHLLGSQAVVRGREE